MVLTSEVRKVTKMCGALIACFEILPLKKKSQIKPLLAAVEFQHFKKSSCI